MNDIVKRGPLFVVGMPRSGTKLLRNLLNQHPKISIDSMETVFLPFWHMNWNRYGNLSNYVVFERFYKKNLRMRYMRNYNKLGRLVSPSKWYQACDKYDAAGVFEALIRSQSGIDKNSDIIWGDKTPSYLVHIPLIRELYPNARIIHIIRDVRDYCLSLNRTWQKNMFRGAQRWVDYVGKARVDGRSEQSYFEITYESLLKDPKREIKMICEFLEIEYFEDIATLSRPSEKFGSAKGKAFIVSDNVRKYETQMDLNTRQLIEAISIDLLRDLGYPTIYQGPVRKLEKYRMIVYKIIDGIKLIAKGRVQNFSDILSSATRRF